MTLLLRTRRSFESIDSLYTSEMSSPASTTRCEVEAPEHAASPKEAPESRQRRDAEAPDAGDGRIAYYEGEYTHGRSKS